MCSLNTSTFPHHVTFLNEHVHFVLANSPNTSTFLYHVTFLSVHVSIRSDKEERKKKYNNFCCACAQGVRINRTNNPTREL